MCAEMTSYVAETTSPPAVPWNGMSLSRMMLGTVQFGMPYGIANRTGQPDYRDVVEMVAAAFAGGVNCFDTAAMYGTSEEVLGRALRELRIQEQVTVVTKVRALTADELDCHQQANRVIAASVAQSRVRLQMDQLPIVLFHREPDAAFLDQLNALKHQGWLLHAGVSCSNFPGPASDFTQSGLASALQIPANVLDRRHLQSGIFDQARAQGVAVFIRSAFLQGLLLMPEAEIPIPLRDVIPARLAMTKLAAEAGMSLSELAVRYLLSLSGVTCILTGVETLAHVHQNLKLFAAGPLPSDLLAAIHSFNPNLSELVLTPAQWPPPEATRSP